MFYAFIILLIVKLLFWFMVLTKQEQELVICNNKIEVEHQRARERKWQNKVEPERQRARELKKKQKGRDGDGSTKR